MTQLNNFHARALEEMSFAFQEFANLVRGRPPAGTENEVLRHLSRAIQAMQGSIPADLVAGQHVSVPPALSDLELVARNLTLATTVCHQANLRWWQDPATQEPVQRNVGELLMLCVSELAEGMEGHRKGLKDDKLPHRSMLEVELVDCLIRVLDLAGGLELDLAGAFREKMEFNAQREDHTHAARLADGGKKY